MKSLRMPFHFHLSDGLKTFASKMHMLMHNELFWVIVAIIILLMLFFWTASVSENESTFTYPMY